MISKVSVVIIVGVVGSRTWGCWFGLAGMY